jgi:uncharacterized ferritin-like protein (DUF455 family)
LVLLRRKNKLNDHKDSNVIDNEHIQGYTGEPGSGLLRPIDTATALKQLLWYEFECSRMAFGWMPAAPDYDAKTVLGRFGYVHNQNAKHLYERAGELPGAINEKSGPPALVREAFERISMAPDADHFYVGYEFLLRQIYTEYDRLYARLDPILDAPTLDKIKILMLERNFMLEWLKEKIRFAFISDKARSALRKTWEQYIALVWYRMNEGLEQGKSMADVAWLGHPSAEPAGPVPAWSALDPAFPEYRPKSEFKKAYSDPDLSPLHDSIKQMHYINATEIGAAESLCYLYYGVQNMPLAFYFDLARHLWDEVRHSQMGVRRLRQLGYSTEQFKFFKGSPGTNLENLKREWFPDMYAGLTMVAEPCSFIKKRKSAEKFWEFKDSLSAIQVEFDMADERMHVDYGKKWGPELYKQIDQMLTSKEMAEKARERRVEQLGVAATKEEIRKIAKDFPGFCGLSTIELEYSKY